MICFDTSPVIWAVQGLTPGCAFPEMPDRTANYVRHLQDEGEVISIPVPTLMEFLKGIPPSEHERVTRLITSSFRVLQMDAKAAMIAAKLEQNRALVKDLRRKSKLSKAEVTVDAQIAAIAISHEARHLVTHNLKHMKDLAQGQLSVIEVPLVERQALIWDSDDFRM